MTKLKHSTAEMKSNLVIETWETFNGRISLSKDTKRRTPILRSASRFERRNLISMHRHSHGQFNIIWSGKVELERTEDWKTKNPSSCCARAVCAHCESFPPFNITMHVCLLSAFFFLPTFPFARRKQLRNMWSYLNIYGQKVLVNKYDNAIGCI